MGKRKSFRGVRDITQRPNWTWIDSIRIVSTPSNEQGSSEAARLPAFNVESHQINLTSDTANDLLQATSSQCHLVDNRLSYARSTLAGIMNMCHARMHFQLHLPRLGHLQQVILECISQYARIRFVSMDHCIWKNFLAQIENRPRSAPKSTRSVTGRVLQIRRDHTHHRATRCSHHISMISRKAQTVHILSPFNQIDRGNELNDVPRRRNRALRLVSHGR